MDPRTLKRNSQREDPSTFSFGDQGDRKQVRCIPQEDQSKEKENVDGDHRQRERWMKTQGKEEKCKSGGKKKQKRREEHRKRRWKNKRILKRKEENGKERRKESQVRGRGREDGVWREWEDGFLSS